MIYDPFGPHALAVIAVTGVVVMLCVLLHYEVFALLTRGLGRMKLHLRRPRILVLMYGLLALHVAGIWLIGVGDLVPTGAIRFMTGTEAITGFLLISWSASFTFLEMQIFWKSDD